MAVKIRLKRMGKIRTPFYRIVIADSRTKRDGRVIEEIGTYNPKTEPSTIHVVSERAQYWLGVGAQPTEAVAALLKITGDIGGTSTLRQPEPKTAKAELFDAALKEIHAEPKAAATTKKAKKADEPKAEKPKAEKPKADEPKADKADEPKADEPKADKADEPKADKVEEPKADKVEEPKADKADEPKVEESAAEEPKADDEAKA